MKTGLLAGLFSVLFSATVFAAPVLKINSSGRDVMLLQQKLQNVGYTIKDIDGIFGEETKRVVTQFQKDNNLRATGVVNNATWRALKDTKSIHHGSIKDKEALLERLKSTAPNYGPTVPNNKPILERSKVSSIISTAKSYIGVPYSFGGATPKAFDCSGYLQYVFGKNGISIPRLADDQYRLGLRTTSKSQLEPGDLVFFTTYEPVHPRLLQPRRPHRQPLQQLLAAALHRRQAHHQMKIGDTGWYLLFFCAVSHIKFRNASCSRVSCPTSG